MNIVLKHAVGMSFWQHKDLWGVNILLKFNFFSLKVDNYARSSMKLFSDIVRNKLKKQKLSVFADC